MKTVDIDSDLYDYILGSIEHISYRQLYFLLREHELNIMAKALQRKFPESIYSRSQLKQIIKEELL